MDNPKTTSLIKLLCATLLSPFAMAQSEICNLVNQSGVSLSAKLISCDGTQVTVERQPDKKTFSFPLSQLNPASQNLLTEWVKSSGNSSEKYQMTINTQKSNRIDKDEHYDDRKISISGNLIISNPNNTKKTLEGNVTVFFLGRPVNEISAIYIFRKQTFDLPALSSLETKTFEIQPFVSSYDDRGYAKYGARYLGYIIMIHDKEQKRIIASSSIPAPLAQKYGIELLALKDEEAYDRDLKKMSNIFKTKSR